ncbi:MAG TPA: transglutaminase family protein [Abditibacterium sp.]|jgi:transglutaminase-like putative cysteine protease
MILQIRARAAYKMPADAFVLLMVEPPLQGLNHSVLSEQLLTTNTPKSELWSDFYGNPQRRLVAPQGDFSFDFSAQIEVSPNQKIPADALEHAPSEIPADAMIYTVPSRYCQSDRLQRLASSEFGDCPPGGARIQKISEWIRERVEYRYGTTDSMTSAYDTAAQRVGVCRDFAHLFISFCRALGVPARYVSGYCLELDPPDFHAYAQVYLGGAWHNVDATFGGVRPALVPIAIGRDAADVAMTTLWGANQFLNQSVEVSLVGS